ncbi:hypothetical protein GCM10008171_30340 [Methylopila jiangsuensis]|uniref:Uncharacterized protein n=1 Tax=Methylopila jiangsuensis TaxID=586230 RepID=A0A9W6JL16_9HYPH|nr:hypothetical protein [Methylopila jiangsuensis]MDR6284829.1 AcrR family transcriptional regulator [Methylopila jiangsuensis]GLK77780.1 hypothetical protein GCM10008171_30340 [Methylopila jiangsuensis]
MSPARRGVALALLAGAIAAPGAVSPARALNEDVMRNILSPVLLAENLAAVCGRFDAGFARAAGGRDGDAGRVLAHMKDEILATMTRDEAAPIVTSAAGAARAIGLGLIRALAGGTVEAQETRMRRLCAETARPFVKGVVDNHDERHEFFEQMLKDARHG